MNESNITLTDNTIHDNKYLHLIWHIFERCGLDRQEFFGSQEIANEVVNSIIGGGNPVLDMILRGEKRQVYDELKPHFKLYSWFQKTTDYQQFKTEYDPNSLTYDALNYFDFIGYFTNFSSGDNIIPYYWEKGKLVIDIVNLVLYQPSEVKNEIRDMLEGNTPINSPGSREDWDIYKEHDKYVKCLSKRKTGFIYKLIKEVQTYLLFMGKVTNFCSRDENIPYYLQNGSLVSIVHLVIYCNHNMPNKEYPNHPQNNQQVYKESFPQEPYFYTGKSGRCTTYQGLELSRSPILI